MSWGICSMCSMILYHSSMNCDFRPSGALQGGNRNQPLKSKHYSSEARQFTAARDDCPRKYANMHLTCLYETSRRLHEYSSSLAGRRVARSTLSCYRIFRSIASEQIQRNSSPISVHFHLVPAHALALPAASSRSGTFTSSSLTRVPSDPSVSVRTTIHCRRKP